MESTNASSSQSTKESHPILLSKDNTNILALLKSRIASNPLLLLSDDHLVLEVGPNVTKVGFVGENAPRFVFENTHSCGFLEPISVSPLWTFPLDLNTFVPKFELQLSELLSDIFHRHLLINPKGKSIVIPESSLLAIPIKENLVRILFEKFSVSSVLFAPSAWMAILTTGKEDGLAIECNEQEIIMTPVIYKTPLHVFSFTTPWSEETWEDFGTNLVSLIKKCAYDDRLRMLKNIVLYGDAKPPLFEMLLTNIQLCLKNSTWHSVYSITWPGNGAFHHGVWVGTSLAAFLKLLDTSQEIKQLHYDNWHSGQASLILDWTMMIEPR